MTATSIISVDVQGDGYSVTGPAGAALDIAKVTVALKTAGFAVVADISAEAITPAQIVECNDPSTLRLQCLRLACETTPLEVVPGTLNANDSDAVKLASRYYDFVIGKPDAR